MPPQAPESIAGYSIAFAVTLAGLLLLMPLATYLGLIDYPLGRKNHGSPTPITGGLAMLAGVLLTGVFLLGDMGPASQGFSLAAIILIVLGIVDDKVDLSWRVRLGFQAIAALVMIYVGDIRVERFGDVFGLHVDSLGVFSVPFTVFATVGIINAINMIDGADGLAGLLILAALVMLDAAALYSGNSAVYERAPILIGAVTGFLVYNLRFPWRPRAKIFMGNAGSGFLGLIIACFTFRLTQNPAHPVSPVLALWLIPVPIVDCLVLMIRRIRQKRSPFSADRNHVHHIMLDAGFGPTQAAVVLTLLSAVSGLAAGVALRLHVPHVLVLLAFVALCVTWYWVSSRRVRAVAIFQALHDMLFAQRGEAVLKPEPED